MTWWKNAPELLEDMKNELALKFPRLRLIVRNEKIIILGIFEIYNEEVLLCNYNIKIVFPDDYPIEIPKVYEIGNHINKSKDQHFIPKENNACLFIPAERGKHFPIGSSISVFLNGPVRSFFFRKSILSILGNGHLMNILMVLKEFMNFMRQILNYQKNRQTTALKSFVCFYWQCYNQN